MSSRNQLTFFPDRAPDETLYSRCARYHHRAGHRSPEVTGKLLFNDPQSGSRTQLPTGLNHFLKAIDQENCSALQLLREQTISPVYMAFMKKDRLQDFIHAKCDENFQSLNGKIGLFGQREFLSHSLKFCPHCASGDINQYGYSYWHRTHQLPGIWICAAHNSLLIERPRRIGEKFAWIKPPAENKLDSNGPPPNNDIRAALTSIADAVFWLSLQDELNAPLLTRTILQNQVPNEFTYNVIENVASACMLSNMYYGRLLAPLEIPEFHALENIPPLTFSQYEPLPLHPIRWAAMLSYFVPRENWDDVLNESKAHVLGHLFPPPKKTSVDMQNDEDTFLRTVLAASLGLSQTSPQLRKTKNQILFSISTSDFAKRLFQRSSQERLQNKYREIILAAKGFLNPHIRPDEKMAIEAIHWISTNDQDWLNFVENNLCLQQKQASLF
ncbi:TniQ family protein [Herbaspirillum camelliae]|uniref:TniQ family protein n=1 Tax=Herbaspirillum camelliae TaxID=1892903 RepID=UPI00094A0B45|nr:TniQ family protein [Herbaspirillum camelliae]